MEWSKAKSLLILLMLAVNLYLGINIYTQVRARANQEEEMVLAACDILRQRGIEFDEEAVLALPSGLQSWTWVRDPEAERRAAVRLLGECTEERPGGGIYVYSSAAGKVIFRSGGYVELQPAEGGDVQGPGQLLELEGENSRLGVQAAEDSYTLSFDGHQITGAQMVRGEDMAWSGTWIFAAAPERGEQSLPMAKLLLSVSQLLETQGIRTIDHISGAYAITSLQSGDIRLVPVLLVEADGRSFCLSAITGTELTA